MALTEPEDDFATMRSAFDLTVAEQIVIWSLRRYKASNARVEALVVTYRQVFGVAAVERALASFGHMIAAIERHCRRRGAPAGLDRLHLRRRKAACSAWSWLRRSEMMAQPMPWPPGWSRVPATRR
jgi:hypothetical protein